MGARPAAPVVLVHGLPASAVGWEAYGADGGLEPEEPDTAGDAKRFPALVDARTVPGAGHFLHREDPGAVLAALR